MPIPPSMSPKNVSIVVVVMALVASAQGATFSRSGASRGQAEQNVLRYLGKGWRGHQLPRLFDPRTHLLRDNTQAICRRSGGGHSAGRFLCVVRPARHRRDEGLYASYRSLKDGRFRIRWLFYRRR
jgi:hypothetical protein